MPGNTNRDKIEDPCLDCKKRHVKCDDTRPKCQHCTRSNIQCIRPSEEIRFRPGSTAKYDSTFAKGQQWPTKSKTAVFQFIDVNPDVEALYTSEYESSAPERNQTPLTFHSDNNVGKNDSPRTAKRDSVSLTPAEAHATSPADRPSLASNRTTTISPTISNDFRTPLSPSKRSLPDDAFPRPSQVYPTRWRPPPVPEPPQGEDMRNTYRYYDKKRAVAYDHPGYTGEGPMDNIGQVVRAEMRRMEDNDAAAIPDDHFLSPAEWRKHFWWPNGFTTNQCTSLMRYFIEELGPWFDAGDPNRTFTTIVPKKACSHPPLLNAIFTAAAFHLVSSKKHQGSDGVIRYQGLSLPRLNGHTPNKYLHAVIAYLQKASDPENVQDDDFLAAAVILRFAEEFKHNTPEDEHAFTPTFRGFMRARAAAAEASGTRSYAPLTHHDSAQTHSPFATYEKQRAYTQLKSFEHACYRIALRQDICAFLLSQTSAQPDDLDIDIELPKTWSALDSFPEPKDEDFIWTDHHLRHLAHVVRFCYRKGQTPNNERWENLKEYERQWEGNKPISFAPYHDPAEYQNGSKARRAAGKVAFVLPQCWFMDEINVIGVQYLELSRLLLAECNPATPRLGHARHKAEAEVRESVTRICGMAMNTSTSVFAKEMAFVAVALTTACFKDPDEHVELLKVLDSLEANFGWPTEGKRREITQVWGIGE